MDRLKDVADAIEWVTDFEGERVAFPAEWKGPEPERSPPDLLPLILLELMNAKDNVSSSPIGPYETRYKWEEEMKRLGHWDDRYEG